MKRINLTYSLLLVDLIAVVLAFRVAYLFRYECGLFSSELPVPPFGYYDIAILLAVGIWTLLFVMLKMYEFPVVWGSPLGIAHLVTACASLIASLLAGAYLAKTYYSRLLLVFVSVLVALFLMGTRIAYGAWLKVLRKRGMGLRRVVIVGQSDLARELAERMAKHQELQYDLVGFVFPGKGRTHGEGRGATLHSSEDLAQELVKKRVDELIFTIPIRRDTEILEFIASCQKQSIRVKVIPEYYELHQNQIRGFAIDGIPIFELRDTSLEPAYQVLKLAMDYSLGLVLLVAFAPLMALIAVSLTFLSKGRIIKREERIGRAGLPFVMYRFDASRGGAAEVTAGKNWKGRVCRFLHRYSLSELPQLWNILKGEMSIVGPRPETPARVRHYSLWHRQRLLFKPGVTGLAQVKGLRGLDSSDLKTKYDLEYAANYTPLLDLTLILATLSTLLSRRKTAPSEREASSVLGATGTLRAKSV